MFKKAFSVIVIIFSFITISEAKIILVTGASGDIGIAIVKNFITKGDFVICHYAHNKKDLEELQKKYPEQVSLISSDFNKPATIQSFWEALLKIKDKINVVINSAGIEEEDTSLEQIQKIMNINYLSPRLICDHAIKHFKEKRIDGIIINIGSRAAYRGLPEGYYTYADSKASLTRYTQSAARDNANRKISLYVVAPGPVEGKMFQGLRDDVKAQCLASMPTGQAVKVQEVVDIVDLLASGKVPSSTAGVFDLMGASWTH